MKDQTVLELENMAYKGCLEYVRKQAEEIRNFAAEHDFVGDLFICATANGIVDQIDYITGSDRKENGENA